MESPVRNSLRKPCIVHAFTAFCTERPVMFVKKLQPVTVTEMDVAELSCQVSRGCGEV